MIASVKALQLLQCHKEAKSPVIHFSAAMQADTASNDLNGRAMGPAAALGVLRCLPYELPTLKATAKYQDIYKKAASKSGVEFSGDRQVTGSGTNESF